MLFDADVLETVEVVALDNIKDRAADLVLRRPPH